jgi:hypothetical protein
VSAPEIERFFRSVPLLEAEPEFLSGIPVADVELARRTLIVPEAEIEAGRWEPGEASSYGDGPFALLVVEATTRPPSCWARAT